MGWGENEVSKEEQMEGPVGDRADTSRKILKGNMGEATAQRSLDLDLWGKERCQEGF